MSSIDTEKEKFSPEKSPEREENGNSNEHPLQDDDSGKDAPTKHGQNQNAHPPPPAAADADENDNENAPPAPATAADSPAKADSDLVADHEIPNTVDNDEKSETTEVKEEDVDKVPEEPTEIPDIEEPSPLPPDLGKVSEEIDEYISSLSRLKVDSDESIRPDVPICVEQFAVLVEAKIDEYDSSYCPVKWTQLTDEDAASLLEATNRVSKLSASLSEYSSDYKYAYSINRIGGVLQRAMLYLEEEFKSLLEDYKVPDADPNNDPKTKQSSSSSTTTNQDAEQAPDPAPESDLPPEENYFPGYSEEILSHLNRLAKALIVGGYETECCQVYFIARRNALEESLQKLGFEKHSIDDVQKMQWESLEKEIVAWIKTFKQCLNVLLPGERKLSDALFPDHISISESLFNSQARGVIIQLLNFSEAVAMTKRAAEKLFKFLDIYETLRDLVPRLDNIFHPECVNEIKSEATLIRSRLGEAMIIIFCELENSIKADTGKTPVPGGAVHPLTRYTMNYLKYACEYKDTLEQVFREHQKIERADSGPRSDFDYGSQVHDQSNQQKAQSSPFQIQMMKVMDLLDTNLEVKSKLYKDLSLTSIFMMNNGRYILQKIRGSPEINNLMGDPWCRKRSSELRQYHKNYQRETWGKPLHCLMHHEGLNVNGKVVKPVLKERFKSFNAMFDEIHRIQSSWVVSDEQLQSELRVSIINMVIPAYRAFLARYGQTLTPGRQTEKYVKFQPEDIETYIDELFDGNATPTGRRKL